MNPYEKCSGVFRLDGATGASDPVQNGPSTDWL